MPRSRLVALLSSEGAISELQAIRALAFVTTVPRPSWFRVPEGFAPPAGRQLTFLLFRGAWTDSPGKGDRTCILWNLTEADEKLALKRTRGEAMRTLDELAKQCVRVVDGHAADWTGKQGPGSVERWWREVGSKCRQQVKNHYVKTHTLDASETADFFTNCVAVRTAVG